MSRFVGAASVAGGDRQTITTWMPSAARLAFVKATQGRSTVALAPLASEQGVVGAALGHRGFAKKEASVRRPCLYMKIYAFRGGVRGSGAGVGGSQKSIKKTAQWLPGELGPRKLEGEKKSKAIGVVRVYE